MFPFDDTNIRKVLMGTVRGKEDVYKVFKGDTNSFLSIIYQDLFILQKARTRHICKDQISYKEVCCV